MKPYLIGLITGIVVVLSVIYIYQHFFLSQPDQPILDMVHWDGSRLSQPKSDPVREDFTNLKIQQNILDQRIIAYNKRIDDVFVLGSIIITLMLFAVAGVYLRTKHEVENHFREHFGIYEKRAEAIVEKTDLQATKALTELEVISKYASRPAASVSADPSTAQVQGNETDFGSPPPIASSSVNEPENTPDATPSNQQQEDANEAQKEQQTDNDEPATNLQTDNPVDE
jgi:hypothetical protein